MAVDKSTVSQASVSDELHKKNASTPSADGSGKTKADEHKDATQKVEEHKDAAKAVDTKLGTSPEEKAAERADVPEERLENPVQNREPKNEFEKENQKVTDAQRKAAQKESDLSTEKRIEKAEAPEKAAEKDAKKTAELNQGSEIAQAISDLAAGKDKFKLEADAGVEPRYSLVKNKQGEVLLRENETRTLSRLQLESIEEKEASIQDQDVEEL